MSTFSQNHLKSKQTKLHPLVVLSSLPGIGAGVANGQSGSLSNTDSRLRTGDLNSIAGGDGVLGSSSVGLGGLLDLGSGNLLSTSVFFSASSVSDPDIAAAASLQLTRCPQHQEEALTLFCQSCELPVCRQVTIHSYFNSIMISDYIYSCFLSN